MIDTGITSRMVTACFVNWKAGPDTAGKIRSKLHASWSYLSSHTIALRCTGEKRNESLNCELGPSIYHENHSGSGGLQSCKFAKWRACCRLSLHLGNQQQKFWRLIDISQASRGSPGCLLGQQTICHYLSSPSFLISISICFLFSFLFRLSNISFSCRRHPIRDWSLCWCLRWAINIYRGT